MSIAQVRRHEYKNYSFQPWEKQRWGERKSIEHAGKRQIKHNSTLVYRNVHHVANIFFETTKLVCSLQTTEGPPLFLFGLSFVSGYYVGETFGKVSCLLKNYEKLLKAVNLNFWHKSAGNFFKGANYLGVTKIVQTEAMHLTAIIYYYR